MENPTPDYVAFMRGNRAHLIFGDGVACRARMSFHGNGGSVEFTLPSGDVHDVDLTHVALIKIDGVAVWLRSRDYRW